MNDIPVTFEYKARQYVGYLLPGTGAGKTLGSVYQLIIDNRYRGQLMLCEDSPPGLPRPAGPIKYKWQFLFQKGEFEEQEMVDYFVDVLIAWYQ